MDTRTVSLDTACNGRSDDASNEPDQVTRDRIGRRLADMVHRQIYEFGAVHADPNPANFAFRPNGDIVLYDFGCVKVFPPEDARIYRDLIRETAVAIDLAGGIETMIASVLMSPDLLYRVEEPGRTSASSFGCSSSSISRSNLST